MICITEYNLIKSGGGNGPVKPGNLLFKVPNPAETRDEDVVLRTESAVRIFYAIVSDIESYTVKERI